MTVKPITIKDFKGGLNLSTSSQIGDNQFSVCKNMFYNQKGQLQTRYGIANFGNPVGSGKPVTSYFFFQRDDSLATMGLCASGTNLYKYDELSSNRSSIKSGLTEFETATGRATWRTRRDYAVYKNVVYLTNGIDNYASFTGVATPAYLTGGTGATSVVATWQAAGMCSFKIGIDGTDYNVGAISFASATTMAMVASYIQFAIRIATGRLETCVWSTNKFIITSTNKTSSSAVTVTSESTVTGGTDISGAGATAFMDAETGRGTATAVVNGYTEYAGQPKYRYVNMTTDRLFGSGDDTNPSTIYYTAAAPADGSALNGKAVVVGGDELGRINGMNELGNIILALKSGKIYSVDVTNERAEAIDAQTGGFSDRTISNVGNSLVYLTERGIDTLKPRTGISGTTALESSPLDEAVRELTTQIQENNLNANCGRYIKRLNNYYISFDTNGDDIPDTTLVYNALVKAWTQYTYPNLYDYGFYINSSGQYQYIGASATDDQLYELEVGFTDLGEEIEHEIKSKAFDFGEAGTFKTYDYIDLIGYKSKNNDIEVSIEVDGVIVGGGNITDAMIIEYKQKETLGTRPIGIDTLTGSTSGEGIDIYEYVARIPLYSTGGSISFGMNSTGGTWTIDRARIGVNGEPIDVFGYNNIV